MHTHTHMYVVFINTYTYDLAVSPYAFLENPGSINHHYYTLMCKCVYIYNHTRTHVEQLSGLISDRADEQIRVEV